jgi:hypothetical protein
VGEDMVGDVMPTCYEARASSAKRGV